MADDGQVRIGIYVDNEGVKSSMDEAVRTVQEGTDKMADAAEDAGKKMGNSVSKGFDTAKLQQNFKEVEAQVSKFAKSIAATATGFGVWIKQSAQSVDRIDKMSQKLGISRKAFQELDYAASQTGLSVEGFGSSMKNIVVSVSNGGEALKQLGISMKDTTGEIKSQEDLFFEVVDKLADMPAGIERSALGFELLGKNFQTMAPLLNKGSSGIEELRKKFHDLGIEVSDKTIDDFVDFNDALTDFGKTLKNSFNNALNGVVPQLKTFVEGMTKMLAPGGQLYDMIGKLAEVLSNFVTNVLPPLLDGFMWILDNAVEVAAGITAIAVAFKALTGNWIGAIATALIGVFSTVLISNTKKTNVGIDEVTKSLKDMGAEIENISDKSSPIVKVSGNMEEMKEKVAQATAELKSLEEELALLPFDQTITNSKQLEDKQTELQSRILTVRTEINKYTESINKLNERNKELTESTQEEITTFDMWTKSVEDAEAALVKFIAQHSTLEGGFNQDALSDVENLEFTVLKSNVSNAKATLQTLTDAFEDVQEEAEKTEAFDKWTSALEKAEEELKDFVALHSDLSGGFDITLLSEDELGQFEVLKKNVNTAQSALDSLNATLKTSTDERNSIISTTKAEQDAFLQWTQALDNAERALKSFIAEKSDLDGGFNIESLSSEDLAKYNELKDEVTKAQKALDSLNGAMRENSKQLDVTTEKIENTDAFEKWTKAVQEAEKALKEFIAAHTMENGKFDINALTEAEKQKFEELKKSVSDAKEQLQSLQDATKESTDEVSNTLVNVADTIAQAWGRVGTALGNGIEATIETMTNGAFELKNVALNLADALTSTLSAVGDALIQAGIAKQVVENLGAVSGSYAIAMGLAIKAAAGAIKGLFDKLKTEGSYATGGIVGGNSYTGDKLLARVNSGEMILNRKQQQQLFALANGKGAAGTGTGNNIQIINNAGDQVTAEQSIDGRSIKILVEKYTSNMLRGVKGSKLMGQTYGIRQLGRK